MLAENMNNERDHELINRAYKILNDNIYPSTGFPWSPYRCLTPAMGHFNGIWNWDSAFHAVGVSRFDTTLAKESILGFLQFQLENGLLPDVIQEDGLIENTYSKPPLFAWATEIVYKRDKNLSFLKEVYPKLVANEKYLVKNRQYEGLFYYDADDKDSDMYLTHVKWESGWDNSPRWDNGITEYWAIDLNCFMVMTYRSLSTIATELKLSTDSKKWKEKEQILTNLINEKMWDKNKNYYADTNRFSREVSTALSPASFMPLYINIATQSQAEFMNKIAIERFEGKMPTVPFDDPAYSNDYWRGPTWLNVAYFATKGLKNYGFTIADEIKENILNMCYNEKGGIYENYDSLTGKGLCCNNFSWSCVFIIEFILNF